jgi:hypothetical protein
MLPCLASPGEAAFLAHGGIDGLRRARVLDHLGDQTAEPRSIDVLFAQVVRGAELDGAGRGIVVTDARQQDGGRKGGPPGVAREPVEPGLARGEEMIEQHRVVLAPVEVGARRALLLGIVFGDLDLGQHGREQAPQPRGFLARSVDDQEA